ncbi:hypothetical protein C8T65DRAFT_739492 [Cerioporus squamosus]|nr:hypothetical protein C8T65DRAFT_739492 [Cerioporus squamosus]
MATQPQDCDPEDAPIVLRLSAPLPDASSLERRIADALRKGLSYSVTLNTSDDIFGVASDQNIDDEAADADTAGSTLYEEASARSEATLDVATELSDQLKKVTLPVDEFVSHSRVSADGDMILAYNGRYMTLGAIDQTLLTTRAIERAKKAHTYRLFMSATQEHPGFSGGRDDTLFKVEIDTGSNDSWLYSPHLLELAVVDEDDPQRSAYTISSFPKRTVPLSKVYAFGVSPPPPRQKTYPPPLPPYVKYIDDSMGLVRVATAPMEVELQDCFKWGKKVEKDALPLRYTFEILYACTRALAVLEDFDGLLGFGTMDYQRAFAPDCPSFLSVLATVLPRPKNPREEIILYFALRYTVKERPVGKIPRMWPSYLIFNRWPSILPNVSFKKIDVYATDTRPGNWMVKLRRIRIMTIKRWNPYHIPLEVELREDGVIELNDQLFVVDTGTALSYFPADAAQHLSQKIFTATREGAVKDAAPYFVTEDSSPETNEKLDWCAVEYDFVNKAGTEVTVRGPARAFVANDEGMGLIWPTKTGWPNILGLSFYHTMFVAKHLCRDRDPYMELAPQWPGLHAKFVMPDDAA